MPKNTKELPWGSKRAGLRDAPAMTLMESPQFRVRLGSAPSGRSPKIKGFIGRIKSMVRQHGGGAKTGRVRAQGGVGGSAAARLAVRAHPQRVIVKARVVRHSKFAARKGGAAGALAKHMDYMGRSGASEDGARGVIFDADTELSREDLRALRSELVDDRHHFRFIVSPEAGSRLDLKEFARELLKEMQTDLGTPLTWIGVAHYDTDDPHVHLLVRGKGAEGGDLVINRDYLSHGMRLQAMEVATRHLGPRLPEDIERSIQRDLKADRLTGLDLSLAQQASVHREGWVSALRKNDGSLAGERQRLQTLTRLQHLESIGLAREVTPGVWHPDIDLVVRLRRLGSRGDIIKLMHERMRGSDPGISTVIFSTDNPPTEPVVGRVYARGTRDELSEAQYLLVEAGDGKAYYVGLSEYSEKSGQEAQVGSLVRLARASRQTGGAGALPDRGAALKVERLSVGDFDTQVTTNGVTWLDREIASGADAQARARVGASRFERQWAGALKDRAQHLKSLGLGEEVEGHFRARSRFLDELYDRELHDAGRRLQSRYGERMPLEEGQTLTGRLEAIEALPSGAHAVVAMPGRYALVPANANLSQQIGRSLSLKIGRGRRLNPMGEGALKLSIRYQFLDLTRTRKLGR